MAEIGFKGRGERNSLVMRNSLSLESEGSMCWMGASRESKAGYSLVLTLPALFQRLLTFDLQQSAFEHLF